MAALNLGFLLALALVVNATLRSNDLLLGFGLPAGAADRRQRKCGCGRAGGCPNMAPPGLDCRGPYWCGAGSARRTGFRRLAGLLGFAAMVIGTDAQTLRPVLDDSDCISDQAPGLGAKRGHRLITCKQQTG